MNGLIIDALGAPKELLDAIKKLEPYAAGTEMTINGQEIYIEREGNHANIIMLRIYSGRNVAMTLVQTDVGSKTKTTLSVDSQDYDDHEAVLAVAREVF